jgi:porphobilinogen synthase
VCAYTDHGQCVLFRDGSADVAGTLERLGEIAVAHADAGADLLIPSGMLDGSVAALRAALTGPHDAVPVAAMAKLESALYSVHRVLVQSAPIREHAVPLLAADDPAASRARALRDVAAGADAVVVTPGTPALDIVAGLRPLVGRPMISYHTADEHDAFVAAAEDLDSAAAERETLAAARRAGADLVITHGAWNAAD